MKAVVTVTGKDTVGIIAAVSAICAECNANIQDITQSVLGEYFAMIMLVDISDISKDFAEFANKMEECGKEKGLVIHAMHEDIFNTMHHI